MWLSKQLNISIVGNYISVQNICSLSLWYPIPKGGLYIPSMFKLGMAIRLPVVKEMEVEEMCPLLQGRNFRSHDTVHHELFPSAM